MEKVPIAGMPAPLTAKAAAVMTVILVLATSYGIIATLSSIGVHTDIASGFYLDSDGTLKTVELRIIGRGDDYIIVRAPRIELGSIVSAIIIENNTIKIYSGEADGVIRSLIPAPLKLEFSGSLAWLEGCKPSISINKSNVEKLKIAIAYFDWPDQDYGQIQIEASPEASILTGPTLLAPRLGIAFLAKSTYNVQLELSGKASFKQPLSLILEARLVSYELSLSEECSSKKAYLIYLIPDSKVEAINIGQESIDNLILPSNQRSCNSLYINEGDVYLSRKVDSSYKLTYYVSTPYGIAPINIEVSNISIIFDIKAGDKGPRAVCTDSFPLITVISP